MLEPTLVCKYVKVVKDVITGAVGSSNVDGLNANDFDESQFSRTDNVAV